MMRRTGTPPPKDFEDLDFNTLEEQWNEYEFPNQTTARGRFIVSRIFNDPQNPNPNVLGISGQNIFVVTAPVEQRGTPSALTPQEIQKTDYPRVTPLTSDEKWNKYRIVKTGVVLKVKLILNEAYRVQGRYDNDGMPAYLFNSTQMVIPDKHANTNFRT